MKDKTLRKKAKGEEAEILLEMNLMWNPLSLFYFFCQAPAQTPQSKKAKTFFVDKFLKSNPFFGILHSRIFMDLWTRILHGIIKVSREF